MNTCLLERSGWKVRLRAGCRRKCGTFASVSAALMAWAITVLASPPEPVVAVHFSEITAALETQPASGLTPRGAGTTGYQWWPTAWHYFVMPQALEEALRSDGTLFVEVSDADIAAGRLLNSDGSPRYPILVSLASEAVADNEIGPLRSYAAAGGTLFLGSSALTRRPDGASRGDFALATEMGLHQVTPGLQNWYLNQSFTKVTDHRLVSHIPSGTLYWQMPLSADEVPWGTALNHGQNGQHYVWAAQNGNAQVIAMGGSGPLLTVKQYGAGRIVYHGAMQPLIGHGGMDAGMYAYGIYRNAIRWAFESAGIPMIKLSPWRYPYDAAVMMRHDFESFTNLIGSIESSAQIEKLLGVKGDYYFCTGELRENMHNDPAIIASLRRAVQNYGATIGSHNGGLKNPVNPYTNPDDYFYWHWGPDEALSVTPGGFYSGMQYATMSIQNSFQDIEGWLAETGQNRRFWVSPFFNSTRDNSYALLQGLGVISVGEQKLSPFPHWTLSTQTSDKRYGHVSIPVSDWFVGATVAQELESHSPQTMHALVDAYYNIGTLINLYGHKLSIESIATDYMTYSLSKPRVWSANSAAIYDWWMARSAVSVSGTVSKVGDTTIARATVSGAVDPETAIEFAVPGWSAGLGSVSKVLVNGEVASPANYRFFNDGIRVKVGTSVTSVEVDYSPTAIRPQASDDVYSTTENTPLNVSAPGVLNNDSNAVGRLAVWVSGPAHGTLVLTANGSFVYSPQAGFHGTDTFIYKVNDGSIDSNVATVSIKVSPAGALYYDDFSRTSDPALASPWTAAYGAWMISGGVLRGGNAANLEASAYIATNWTDYSVQADIQMGIGLLGGGLGGRVNPINGARYAAWIYPETTSGNFAQLRLLKFSDWWNFTLMQQQVTIPSVGSKWHTLRLSFQGNQISAWLDGVSVATAVDNGIGGRPALGSGGVSADLWSGATPSCILLTNVSVSGSSSEAPPRATNDSYSVVTGVALSVSAPGVLANDFAAPGRTLTAGLVSSTAHGTLVLNSNGSFTYTPENGFVGNDSFTYNVSDGSLSSNSGVVTLSVSGSETLFYDDFTRATVPGELLPWTAKQGSWTVTGGMLHGSSRPGSYGNACVGGPWMDYSVQADIQMAPGVYGGGLGGRANTASGAHYAAWIYPETTPGGPAVLRLIKFSDWWSFTTMQQLTIPAVGTGWHTLRLEFKSNKISVWLDGVAIGAATDNGYGGTPALASGGICADLWNSSVTSGIALTRVVVSTASSSIPAPPTATNDSYSAVAGTPLTVSAPGVLANDYAAPGKTLTAILASSPAHGALTWNSNGSFIYTPTAGFAGNDSFTYKASDGSLESSNAIVTLSVAGGETQVPDFVALSAWTAKQGVWSVTGEMLLGTSTPSSYGNASVTGSWTDFSVQAEIKMGVGVYGGGLGGRVDSATGAHYAAWIYPETTPGGPAMLRLVKFRDWWSFGTMQQASIPALGSGWHTLKLGFETNRISVWLDGASVVSVVDNGFGGTGAYASGGISADLWNGTTAPGISLTRVTVSSASSSSAPLSPIAVSDSYRAVPGAPLTVAGPGLLANDSAAPNKTLIAILVSPTAHGTLVLNTNGSFTYTSAADFSGSDSFVYKVFDGSLASSNAVVTLSVSRGTLFFDDFTRPANPGALVPWVAKQGSWSVTEGVLHGSSAPISGGNACVSGTWTNYSVQAEIKLGAEVYGGGLGGRVNVSTGERYAAWIYPQAAVLRLVKFSDWWSFTSVQQVSIPAIGSGWHTLKLVFQGNQISVWLDGASVTTAVDNGFGGRAAISSGGISADFWSASSSSGIVLENVTVSSLMP